MKKFFSFIVCFMLILSSSFGYVIEEEEKIEFSPELDWSETCYVPIAHSDFDNFTYTVSPVSANQTEKYVKSYVVGGRTALQVCSIGNTDGCAHQIEPSYDSEYVSYAKSEIVDVVKPTCLENGSMTIKCKNKITTGWFIFSKEEECGKTETIILEKTGHTVSEHSIDGRCENCNEIHSKKELLLTQTDEENHYYSCSFEGCTEVISEQHDFKQDSITKKWICSICKREDTRHKAVNSWSFDAQKHYKKCAVEGCSEVFDESNHSGGTHKEGICEICKKQYQTHSIDTSVFSFDDKGHIYGCSYEGCKEVFNEPHEKGNMICHDKDYHWYACNNEDCGKIYDKEKHSDGGNNDGTCTVCKLKYATELEEFYIEDAEKGGEYISEIGDNVKLELVYFPENLANTEFVWKVDDEEIATVTQDGVVTAVSEGITVVHVFWKDKEITCTIYVATGFEIEADDDEILEGEETKVSIITENVTGNVTWSVEPKDLGRIKTSKDTDKEITLHASPGKAKVDGSEIKIYAKLDNGLVTSTEVFIKHGEIEHKTEGCRCRICGMLIDCTECDLKKDNGNKETGGGTKETGSGTKETGDSTGTTSEWKSNRDDMHWRQLPNGSIERKSHQDKDNDGFCDDCNWNLNKPCDHKNKGTYKIRSSDENSHYVCCKKCNAILRTEVCTDEKCECRNAAKKPDTLLDIPTKVYYIEEGGLFSVEEYYEGEGSRVPESIIVDTIFQDEEKFVWELSTIPNRKFYSSKNDVANDGTIKFWYDEASGTFQAKLTETDRTYLSGEVIITITLEDSGRADSQEIKIIKNGPPSSVCQIFLESQYVALEENSLKLLIKTKYDDFDGEVVRKLRNESSTESEFPLYTVKDGKITVNSSDESKIKITGTPKITEVKYGENDATFNGYMAEIPVSVSESAVGGDPTQLEISLTTEYTFNKHKTIEKDRIYSTLVYAVKTVEEKPKTTAPVSDSPTEDSEQTSSTSESSSSGKMFLAATGAIVLLIIAVTGKKMFDHH